VSLIARSLLIVFGLILLIFGVWDLLVPRARFVSSSPQAASTIANPPSIVTIKFTNNLAPESKVNVTSTMMLLPSGEVEYLKGESVVATSGLDPGDPKSLRAELKPALHQGLYAVNWNTTADGWRTRSYGRTYFGVGMVVPESILKESGSVWERDYDFRGDRAALVGGAALIILGWWLRKASRN
jgi:methionine-rich copper-binding protein CopC